MATAVKFGSKSKRAGMRLDPALKEFLDTVVIPTLVKEYLSEDMRENQLALVPKGVTESTAGHLASAEVIQ